MLGSMQGGPLGTGLRGSQPLAASRTVAGPSGARAVGSGQQKADIRAERQARGTWGATQGPAWPPLCSQWVLGWARMRRRVGEHGQSCPSLGHLTDSTGEPESLVSTFVRRMQFRSERSAPSPQSPSTPAGD